MIKRQIITTTLALFAAILQTLVAYPAGKYAAGQPSPVERFSYVKVFTNDTPTDIADSLFYEISRKVVFPVNKFDIPQSSTFRREIVKELMPFMNDRYLVLDQIIVRGAASPEGPYERNKMLAEKRTRALIDLLREHSVFRIKEQPVSDQVAEDYGYLLRLMKDHNDKDVPTVERIILRHTLNVETPVSASDKINVETPVSASKKTNVETPVSAPKLDEPKIKAALMKVDGGRLWTRLKRDYFPELRSARVVLVFRRYFDVVMKDVEAADFVAPKAEPRVTAPSLTVEPTKETVKPRRELLSVKTNLLHDFAYMPGYNRFCPIPNIAVEYYPLNGHFTFGASIDFPWWQDYDDHKYFQVRNYQLEARYYLKSGDVNEVGHGNGPAFKGWFLQAYGQLGLYNICFDADRGWEGEAAGGGLGFGYVMPLGKDSRWRLELGAQVGFLWTKYDPYQWLCPVDGDAEGEKYFYKWTGKAEDFTERQHRFTWIGPTRIGVTLTYDLLYRKRTENGCSFKRFE